MPVNKPKVDQKHLTIEDRAIIEAGIKNRACKADIARTLAKDPSTIAKEIRAHRIFKPRNTFNSPNICIHLKEKGCEKCYRRCLRYEEPVCKFRDRSPGACNGCAKRNCRLDKYYYDAVKADQAYRATLSEAREGFNLEEDERSRIGILIAPLLKQGQSVYQVLTNHPEIDLSARSLYTYIEAGLFKEYGVDNFSLKEQVNRRPRKTITKKRKDPAHYDGRRYSDYLQFMEENPDIPAVEMDTVYNHPSGPYVQTMIFPRSNLMIGFLHKEKTSMAMASSLDILEERLGLELYSQLFSVYLTDRGAEFEIFSMFETSHSGCTRSRIFYCDPRASQEKPVVESNHNFVRDILPNELDLNFLTQEKIETMMSHINSAPRKVLGNRTPVEIFAFMHGKDILDLLHVREIPRDQVVLKPTLLTR